MKKLSALILACVLMLSLLAGCAGTTVVIGNCDGNCKNCPQASAPQETAPQETQPAEGAVMTGLSVSTKISESKSATAEAAGEAKYDVTLAAVLVDENGVIVDCVIDSVPATVQFDVSGNIVSALDMEVPTKNEMGENYGMVAWGGAKFEWNVRVVADSPL